MKLAQRKSNFRIFWEKSVSSPKILGNWTQDSKNLTTRIVNYGGRVSTPHPDPAHFQIRRAFSATTVTDLPPSRSRSAAAICASRPPPRNRAASAIDAKGGQSFSARDSGESQARRTQSTAMTCTSSSFGPSFSLPVACVHAPPPCPPSLRSTLNVGNLEAVPGPASLLNTSDSTSTPPQFQQQITPLASDRGSCCLDSLFSALFRGYCGPMTRRMNFEIPTIGISHWYHLLTEFKVIYICCQMRYKFGNYMLTVLNPYVIWCLHNFELGMH